MNSYNNVGSMFCEMTEKQSYSIKKKMQLIYFGFQNSLQGANNNFLFNTI